MYEPRDRDPRILEDAVEWAREEFWSLSTELGRLEAEMNKEFFFEVSRGAVPGYNANIKFGRVVNIAAGADTVVAPFVPTYLTTASPVRVAGGDVADDAGGIGARTVHIWGLDDSYNEIDEVLTTAGASPSAASTNSYLRVTRSKAVIVGSNEANVGNIVIEATSDSSTQALILAGNGQTEQAFLTVPAGQTAFLVGSRFSLIDQPGAGNTQHLGHIKCWVRDYNEASYNNYASWRTVFDTGLDTDGNNNVPDHTQIADPIPEKTDIKTTVYSHTVGAQCDARLFIVFRDN